MNARQLEIIKLLNNERKIEVTKLSELLSVSQVTIRKDLVLLEQQGVLVREHGYATLNNSDDINMRLANRFDSKQQIAKLAATFVHDGETIMIESGSCCALLALEIVNKKSNVTIITNSAFIANYIRKSNDNKVILLGGEYQKQSQVMVGPLVRKCVEAFYVDKLFIGIDGFQKETGVMGNDYLRCEAVQDMAKQASQVIVVSDSSKFNHKGLVHLLSLKQISTVVSDDISLESEQFLASQNIKVYQINRPK